MGRRSVLPAFGSLAGSRRRPKENIHGRPTSCPTSHTSTLVLNTLSVPGNHRCTGWHELAPKVVSTRPLPFDPINEAHSQWVRRWDPAVSDARATATSIM